MKTISICIPTYEMHGKGVEFLRYSFEVMKRQTFKDFDVVVSDHSKDNKIEDLCKEYSNTLDIQYYKNTEKRGSSSANLNNAIQHSTGRIVKLLMQDDFLFGDHALEHIAKIFQQENVHWLATACNHTTDGMSFFRPFTPRYDDTTILKKNTLSSPSVTAIRNKHIPPFDENLLWWTDTDFYKRCFELYGQPTLISEVLVTNRVGEHQVSHTLATESLKFKEYKYMLKKYKSSNRLLKVMLYALNMYKILLKKKLKKLL